MLKMAAISPHPPIAIPAVGGRQADQVAATGRALEKLATEINRINPETIVAITPHGPLFEDAITITLLDTLEGDLSRFGAQQAQVKYDLDKEAAEAIIGHCRAEGVACTSLDNADLHKFKLSGRLDHGLVVPLYYLTRTDWNGKIVPVNMGLLTSEELYRFGMLLKQAMDKIKKSWVLLISGDMSHRLTPDAPAGYSPKGAVFDKIIRQSVREGDLRRLFNLDPDLIEEAGECGLRPIMMGLGAFDGHEFAAEELSYEGPFGVGYFVAILRPGQKSAEREFSRILRAERKEQLRGIETNESEPVRLARASISHYLREGIFMDVPDENKESGLMQEKAGAFVSLKKQGDLRGCIGTIEPVRGNLAEEIIRNAVSAAVDDPRFAPIESEELAELTISVDVLETPEPIAGIEELDPEIYGVIVTGGRKRGLLLPNLAGVESAAEQVEIAMNKAGITGNEKISLARFRVRRYY